jgi:hypothetical protein
MGLTVVVVIVFSPTGELSQWLYDNVIFPVEASLLALISIVYFMHPFVYSGAGLHYSQ